MNDPHDPSGSGSAEDPRYTEAVGRYLDGLATREQLLEEYPDLRSRLEAFFSDGDFVDERVQRQPTPLASPAGERSAGPTGYHRYRILGPLGQGGMGVVLRAFDTVLEREVALKMLRVDRAHRPGYVERMQKEARILARLQHDGIAPVYDVGETPDRRPFLTMKLIEGDSLGELLGKRSLTLDRALEIFDRVCEAVAFAHALTPPVLHRDLKPSNVRVNATTGEVCTVDWGLARMREKIEARPESETSSIQNDAERRELSRDGAAVGTLAYMAPEQQRREAVGPASDVFSLGLILFEVLTGEPAWVVAGGEGGFRGFGVGDGLVRVGERLARCRADRELKAIARKCLEARPEARFQNAGEVAGAVQDYQQGVRDRLARSETRRRWQLIFAGIGVVVVVVGSVWWHMSALAKQERYRRNSDQGNTVLGRYDAVVAESDGWKQKGELETYISRLEAVQSAREQLKDRVVGGEIEEPVRRRLAAVGEEIETSLDLARRQEKLVRTVREATSLAGARFAEFEVDSTEAAKVFRSAFAGFGVRPANQSPEEAAALLDGLAPGIRDEVLGGMDHWRLISKEDGERIGAILEKCDKDAWRVRLRESIRGGDVPALLGLAEEGRDRKVPPASLRILAVALRVADRADDAVVILQRGVLQYPTDFGLHLELAHTLERQLPPRGEQILAAYQTAVSLRPDSALAWMGRAYAHGAMGDHGQADECYARALALAPGNPLIRLNQYSIRFLRGEEDLAGLRALRNEYPDRAEVAAVFARQLATRPGSLSEAKELLAHACELDKDCPQIPLTEAFVALAEKRYADYLRIVQKLRRADPGEQNLVRAECLGLITIGEYEEAERLARRCLEGGKLPAFFARTCMELLAFSLILQGRPAEAEPWAREAIRLHDPQGTGKVNGQQKTLLFQVSLQQGKFEEALQSIPTADLGKGTPLGALLAPLVSKVPERTLRRCIALRERLRALKLDASDAADPMTPETALALDMPRYAYPLYQKMLTAPFVGGMMSSTPSPLWMNELYQSTLRMNAARAAVRAGCDPPREPIRIAAKDLADARKQGLAWLQQELDGLTKSAKRVQDRGRVNGVLCLWQQCPDFAGVRDPGRLAELPAQEARDWKDFWDKVTDLRKTVRWKPDAQARP